MLARCHHFEVPQSTSLCSNVEVQGLQEQELMLQMGDAHISEGDGTAQRFCAIVTILTRSLILYIYILYIISIVAINYIGAIVLGPAFCDGRFAFVFFPSGLIWFSKSSEKHQFSEHPRILGLQKLIQMRLRCALF